MDPLTHALLGACTAQAVLGSPKRDYVGRYTRRHVWLVGALGGLLPDLDVLIRSAGDPLLAIEYHRHFTHSLIFIPLGGLLAALPWLYSQRQRLRWRLLWAAGSLGCATHGLLDACTNYGTHLLWPVSDQRVAWHWLTTIGPLLTLGLLLGLGFALKRRTRTAAVMAVCFTFTYIVVAAIQQGRAAHAQAQIAAQRGHVVVRGELLPTVGNPFIWRSLYESSGTLYVDRVRVMGSVQWQAGHHIPLMQEANLPPELLSDPAVREDFQRFSYFSADWVARDPADPSIIGDARYSLSSQTFQPIWGVRFHGDALQVTEWVDRTRQNHIPFALLWSEIKGSAPDYLSLN